MTENITLISIEDSNPGGLLGHKKLFFYYQCTKRNTRYTFTVDDNYLLTLGDKKTYPNFNDAYNIVEENWEIISNRIGTFLLTNTPKKNLFHITQNSIK